MGNRDLAYRASLVCLAGGTIQILYGLLAIPFGPYSASTLRWNELLWALATAGMIGGVAGLLALDVARPRALALAGGALAILGNLARIVVSVLLILRPSPALAAAILASIALLLLGLAALGVATVRGGRLHGWRAWTPLLAAGSMLVPVAVYAVSPFVHTLLLGLWGLPWLLIGAVVHAQSTAREPAARVRATGAAAQP